MKKMKNQNASYTAIHLDLKGLVPTDKRLCQLPEMFASFGINAILVEWEDTFPYKHFPEMKKHYTYSKQTVHKFLKQADRNNITVIPLIQTFGHLESLLILNRYKHIREVSDSPQCLCPLHKDSLPIIQSMLSDVIEIHKQFNLPYIHLGADEVWSLGSCRKCKQFLKNHSKVELFLHHIMPILEFVNKNGIRAIIWHDMLNELPAKIISKLKGLTDLMFWSYTPDEKHFLNFIKPRNIKKCISAEIDCWAAGAYKGADGFDAILPNLENRIKNIKLWKKLMNEYKFKGFVLTAWSRYDTLGQCCEPTEACWDSLALCLTALKKENLNIDKEIKAIHSKLFGTDKLNTATKKNNSLKQVYSATNELKNWISKFLFDCRYIEFRLPQSNNRVNIAELKKAILTLKQTTRNFDDVEKNFKSAMKRFVKEKEIDEFLQSKYQPRKKLAQAIESHIRKIIKEKQ